VRAKLADNACLDQELRFAYGARRRTGFFEICERSFARAAQLARGAARVFPISYSGR